MTSDYVMFGEALMTHSKRSIGVDGRGSQRAVGRDENLPTYAAKVRAVGAQEAASKALRTAPRIQGVSSRRRPNVRR